MAKLVHLLQDAAALGYGSFAATFEAVFASLTAKRILVVGCEDPDGGGIIDGQWNGTPAMENLDTQGGAPLNQAKSIVVFSTTLEITSATNNVLDVAKIANGRYTVEENASGENMIDGLNEAGATSIGSFVQFMRNLIEGKIPATNGSLTYPVETLHAITLDQIADSVRVWDGTIANAANPAFAGTHAVIELDRTVKNFGE